MNVSITVTSPTPIIAICNHKGGSGKTTTAWHLAHALNADDAGTLRRVLLVDLDDQATLTNRLAHQAARIGSPIETQPTLLAFALGAVLGIVAGAMTLDRYHERQRAVLLAIADAAEAERDIVRAELARSESLADALSREISVLKAQRSQAEALHAERIRRTLTEAARWN